MRRVAFVCAFFVACALFPAVLTAQAYTPIVTMKVTLPDGSTQEITAPESGTAKIVLKDGTEYGFRATIHDDKPWNRVVVTVFRMPTASSPTELLGDLELKTGGPAQDSKTKPSFKIAISRVAPPAQSTEGKTTP